MFVLLMLGAGLLLTPAEAWDASQLCDLSDYSHRKQLLNDAMSKLEDRYSISNGVSLYGTCDPTDPDIREDCANFNNPSVYYGSTQSPCADRGCSVYTPSTFLPGRSGYFQPDKDEALLLFGCLPPPCAYFGIRSYLYERGKVHVNGGNPPENSTGQRPPNPTDPATRVVVDTPWYDTYNHLNIKVWNQTGNDKFRSAFALVVTADQNVAEDISQAFVQSGLPSSAINIDGIPDILVLHGLPKDRDSFRMVLRLAKPCENEQDESDYVRMGSNSVFVRKIEAKVTMPYSPFAMPIPTERSTGVTESDIIGQNTLTNLLQAVSNVYGTPHYIIYAQQKTFDSMDCIVNGSYCWGDNYDTAYIDFDGEVSIEDDDDFAVACGVDHLKLQYAVYTTFGLYYTSGLAVAVVDDAMKVDSASCFAPNLPNVDKMYCVEIRSKCAGGSTCIQPMDGLPSEVDTVLLQARVNLNPTTKTGPDPNELILPVVYGYRDHNVPQTDCITQ